MSRINRARGAHAFARGSGLVALLAIVGTASASSKYLATNLVSDQPGEAAFTDPNLKNGWGVVFNPTGFVWVSSEAAGKSTLYDGNGVPQSLVVDIPSSGSPTGGEPTGIVFSGGSDFIVSDGSGASGPARFLFASEDGTISGWNPQTPPPPPSTQAFTAVDNSASGAIYKGLGLAATAGGSRLYATDFHNGKIDTFDGSFSPVAAAFDDPNLPSGYAPFNVRAFGGKVYVTYAVADAAGEEDVPGAGNGIVSVFSPDGTFEQRLVTGGELNSPWGLAVAPGDFGRFSNALLVGNFGDGRINAFDPSTGDFLGAISDTDGNPIEVEGLWGIEFGNGVFDQPLNTLFFAAGPDDEKHGLYGRIDLIPSPGGVALGGVVVGFAARRRRR